MVSLVAYFNVGDSSEGQLPSRCWRSTRRYSTLEGCGRPRMNVSIGVARDTKGKPVTDFPATGELQHLLTGCQWLEGGWLLRRSFLAGAGTDLNFDK